MKKVLALILTAAMLLSTLAVGIAAARVFEVTTVEKNDVGYQLGAEALCNDWGAASFIEGDYTLEILMYSSAWDNPETLMSADNGHYKTAWADFSKGQIGIDESGKRTAKDYDFQPATWYDLKWVKADGDTEVFVNGESLGKLGKEMGNCLYWTRICDAVISTIKVTQGDNVVYNITYDDLSEAGALLKAQGASDPGSLVDCSRVELFGEYDLGLKYYYWDYDTVAYHHNKSAKNAQNISFDFAIDTADGGFINDFAGDSIVLTPSKVAIGANSIALNLDLNTWYHIEFVDTGDVVKVYLDGSYIGNLGSVICPNDNGFCGHASHIAIDNMTINGVCEDFEDGSYDFDGDTEGMCLNYEFAVEEEKTLFDYIPAPELGGTAYLIENSWDGESNYIEHSSVLGKLGDHYIVDFNLAILPTNDSADGNYFELWTNWNAGAPVRWKVGTEFAGKDEDLVQFDWGEATIDNVHRVTYEFANGKGYIYIDGAKVYEGFCGSYKDLGTMLMMPWNASVVLDDFAIYNGEYKLIKDATDLKIGNVGNNITKWINLDATCADNGCITGKTVMDYDSTCYSLGQYTTKCAVCGDVKDTHTIALKDHSWGGYNINQKTETGLVYIYCKNSGCVEKRYTELPKNYEGKLYQFYDMQDDFVLVMGNDTVASFSGLDGRVPTLDNEGKLVSLSDPAWEVTEDGKLEFLGHAVYDEFWGIESAKMPVNDWSISYDFFLDESKHWKNEDGGVDSECFFIRCCGSAGYQLQVGWDRNTKELFIRKTDGSKVLASMPYTFENLTTYNFKVACKYEGYGYTHEDDSFEAPWYAEIAIYVNGEKVLAYGDTTGADVMSIYEIAYGADQGKYQKFPTFGQFGTSYTIDNLAFGSYDFQIVKLAGDIDGDGDLTAADATMMRQYLAGIITVEDFVDASVADVNGDGAINAKDQLAIRIALAA